MRRGTYLFTNTMKPSLIKFIRTALAQVSCMKTLVRGLKLGYAKEILGLLFCHTYPPFTRKRIVSLYLGRDVRTRLGVAIWATCLPHKGGGVPLSALPKNTTSKLAGLFSTTSHKCRAPSREAVDTIIKSLLV